MPNVRIIYDNVANSASITASTTATGFSVANLKNDQKSSVHRSSSSNVTYTLTWTTAVQIQAVALPATNLVSGDQIRVQLYTETADATAVADSGTLAACTGKSQLLPDGTTIFNYVSFSRGTATKTSVWFSQTYTIKKMIITITSTNTVDCARIVCGKYWESIRQVSNGISLGVEDNSEITYTRGGDMYVDTKHIKDTMNFELSMINDTDRLALLNIMRKYGIATPVYVCVFPDNTNPEITQNYSIYGRLQPSSINYMIFNNYSTSLNIISW